MSRLTKMMLGALIINAIASVLFLTGIVDVSDAPGLYAAFPLAAVFYGMFLISRMLEKEIAAFDAEHHAHHDAAVPDHHPEPAESSHGHELHEPVHA